MSYPATSPYYATQVVNQQYLDVMTNRPIYGDSSDIYYQISQTFNLRPDLLAHDLYGDSRLWWVFAQRNPNTPKDPFFDFTTGTSIYLPTQGSLTLQLGL